MIIGRIALAGNPNVGKSTVFNALTGMKQHTGNWSGKTVGMAEGSLKKGGKEIRIVDLPGTYSLTTDSAEEEVTRDFLCFEKFDAAVVVCDACCLERNLILAMQVAQLVQKTILCVNMLDDAERKGIKIDFDALSIETGLPVFGISAAKGEGLKELENALFELAEGKAKPEFILPRYPKAVENALSTLAPAVKEAYGFEEIYPVLRILENEKGFVFALKNRFGETAEHEKIVLLREKAVDEIKKSGIDEDNISDKIAACTVLRAEEICLSAVSMDRKKALSADDRVDSVLTGKLLGIPVMLMLFALIFWITVSGANYPSEWLSALFEKAGGLISKCFSSLGMPEMLKSLLLDGVWKVMGWVVAVMLPPMAIFFPLFTVLEDIGYLPRVAFNLDRGFKAAGACGKQALTMCLVYKREFLHILVWGGDICWNIPRRFI